MDKTQLEQANALSHSWFPKITRYAPNVGQEAWTDRMDVAGRYDPSTQSVMVNTSRTPQLNEKQLAGLIALERMRGLLSSPEGPQFTNKLSLSSPQYDWWDKFYLPKNVSAPSDRPSREQIIKSTILSRLAVGDTLPHGAPILSPAQQDMGRILSDYASGRSVQPGQKFSGW